MFIKSDGGRSQSKRPKQNGDCTVKAAAIACDVSYDEAYDAIKKLGRNCNQGFWLPTGKKTVRSGVLLGKQWNWVGIHAPAKGEKWPTVEKLVRFLPGTVVLRVSRHVIAVRNGDWFDDSNAYQFATVRGYWRIE